MKILKWAVYEHAMFGVHSNKLQVLNDGVTIMSFMCDTYVPFWVHKREMSEKNTTAPS